jgi:PAS domain S-box-containing protein
MILLTQKDVTQIRVRREMKQVAARFQALLESAPDGIVMVNPTGHIIYANSHAERLFGYEPMELHGKVVEMLLPRRFGEAHLAHRAGYFAQPRKRSMGEGLELFGLRKDGIEFPVEISLSPLQMEETSFVLSAVRDISYRKGIEQELREKNIALEGASRAKDRFLASMSHELRTPLNAIIGFTGTLLMKLPGPLNAEQEQQLHTVQTSARHLLSLINDLLDVAKIEAGKLELRPEHFDCRDVVESIVRSVRPQAEKKGLPVSISMPDEALLLNADRRALSQIIINLTDNAIKFTQQGSIHIQGGFTHADSGPAVELSVADTGPGIRPEDQARLFQAFERVEEPHQVVSGTGLGLHLSRKLAELMGGRLVLTSEYGRGTTFTLVLPQGT